MIRKKIFKFSLILLIFIICLSIVSAQDNTTQILEKNTTAIASAKSFEDIQLAIDNANENDTIELDGTYISHGKEITITKSLTITSKNGTTLDGREKSSIFNITNVNVCLANLKIINSKSNFQSAIHSTGNLTVIDSNFTNNHVEVDPGYDSEACGAIYSTKHLKIINSTFEDNDALEELYDEYGGYLIPHGGAIYSTGNLIIEDSKFFSEIKSKGEIFIRNSYFSEATVSCLGNSTIVNSTFNKYQYANAINIYSNLTLINCNFTNNGRSVIDEQNLMDKTIIIKNCNFINNNLKCAGTYDYGKGEEVFNEEYTTINTFESDIYVYNSNFANNTKGAINARTLLIINSSFSKNSAYYGGAIASSNATVINSTFTDNYANFAGAIYSNTLFLQNCNFTNNNEAAIGIAESATINNQTYNGHEYFDNSLNELKVITASVGKLTTTYQSGKTLQSKFTYTETKHPVKNTWIDLKIIKGKKVYYDDVLVNSKGIANYKASNLAVGTYKIIFNYEGGNLPKITTTVKITKAKTIIKAPKVTNKYKKSRYFKVTIKNKATKKAVKNTYVKVKIDKQTYKIKTNSKGIAKFNTKKLKIGKHKVTIASGNTNYVMSAKSTIIIKK